MSERVAASFHHLRQVLFQLAETRSDEFPFWNLNQPQMHAHLGLILLIMCLTQHVYCPINIKQECFPL
jgi:hypothetical protein